MSIEILFSISKVFRHKGIVLIIVLMWGFSFQLNAQCSPAAAASGACSGGQGQAADGQSYANNNDVYWYPSGSSANFGSGVNFNSKTGTILRVCGDLTLNNVSNSSGSQIIVESGGVLTFSSNLDLNGGLKITNYGTLTISGNATLGSNNCNLITAVGATTTINGKLTLNNSTSAIVVNKGTLTIQEITVNSCASCGVCLESGSCFNINNNGRQNWENNTTNAFSYGSASGKAVVRHTGEATFNNNLTSSTAVNVCRAATATGQLDNSSKWGSAVVTANCASCSAILPIELLSFDAELKNDVVWLTWVTAAEINNDYFTLERSIDGINFTPIGNVNGAGNSSTILNYQYIDDNPFNGTNYYRLKQTDFDGKYTYSELRSVSLKEKELVSISIDPELNVYTLKINSKENAKADIKIYNSIGQLVFGNGIHINKGENKIPLFVFFDSGIYYYTVRTSADKYYHDYFLCIKK